MRFFLCLSLLLTAAGRLQADDSLAEVPVPAPVALAFDETDSSGSDAIEGPGPIAIPESVDFVDFVSSDKIVIPTEVEKRVFSADPQPTAPVPAAPVPVPETEAIGHPQPAVNGTPTRTDRDYPRGFFSPTLGAHFAVQAFHTPALGRFPGVRMTSDPVEGSPLKQIGLSRGDVITRLDGAPVVDLNELEMHVEQTHVRYIKEATTVVHVGVINIDEYGYFEDPSGNRSVRATRHSVVGEVRHPGTGWFGRQPCHSGYRRDKDPGLQQFLLTRGRAAHVWD
jgi:hypothetical protein